MTRKNASLKSILGRGRVNKRTARKYFQKYMYKYAKAQQRQKRHENAEQARKAEQQNNAE